MLKRTEDEGEQGLEESCTYPKLSWFLPEVWAILDASGPWVKRWQLMANAIIGHRDVQSSIGSKGLGWQDWQA